jgi:hypothetical protein
MCPSKRTNPEAFGSAPRFYSELYRLGMSKAVPKHSEGPCVEIRPENLWVMFQEEALGLRRICWKFLLGEFFEVLRARPRILALLKCFIHRFTFGLNWQSLRAPYGCALRDSEKGVV